MKTAEVIAALRRRYPPHSGEWAFYTEVPNGTGGNRNRSCDAIAMNLWPSKGLALHGHEVKVSRSDWQKEIQDTSKAEAFAKYCDYWWIVAPNDVLKVEELPTDWGWICPTKTGNARVRKPANKRVPELWPREFLAGILRSASKMNVTEKAIREAEQSQYSKGYRDGLEVSRKADSKDWELERLRKRVEELELVNGEFESLKKSGRDTARKIAGVRNNARRVSDSLLSLIELADSVELSLAQTESH